MNEKWKPVVGYEGYYEVSNMGNIRSLDRVDSLNHKRYGKLMSPIKSGNSYLEVKLCKGNGLTKRVSVHRIVAIAFIENHGNKRCVNHIDCERHNNVVGNLEWVTHKENTAHGIKLGRIIPTRKQIHKRYRLSDDGLKELLSSSLKNKEMALKLGISRQYVGYLRKLNS